MTAAQDRADRYTEIARENLRLAIAIRNTSASEVSRAAGLSVNALSHFLRGKGGISYPSLLAACEVLSVPIGILHHPNAITPARLSLHSELEGLTADELLALVRETDQAKSSET